MGKPEGKLRVADRLEVDDLSNFVGSVIMAEQLGISMETCFDYSRRIRQSAVKS